MFAILDEPAEDNEVDQPEEIEVKKESIGTGKNKDKNKIYKSIVDRWFLI